MSTRPSRKDEILGALAAMLEEAPGARITTAGLAKQVGVSEAALYRHFPSKAKMYEGLIEFIENTLFSRISVILGETEATDDRCRQMVFLILSFAEKNPGITRILTGDPLAGESDRLRVRVAQLFERLETQFKQVLREADLRDRMQVRGTVAIAAGLMMNVVEGRLSQFVRTEFRRLPTEEWTSLWLAVHEGVFLPGQGPGDA